MATWVVLWYNDIVTYALRKLIAFVFLGGIFWFIYQDLDNLGKPWFTHALGVIVILFALFWLVVPLAVVRYRIYCRRRQNAVRYAQWRAGLGEGGVPPCVEVRQGARIGLAQGERVYLHEKGTLYVPRGVDIGEAAREGRPSEVAFPDFNRRCSVLQRVHCYITDRRIVFAGKALSWNVPSADLRSALDAPGGIVFKMLRGGELVRVAFTFQNPLVVADVIRLALR